MGQQAEQWCEQQHGRRGGGGGDERGLLRAAARRPHDGGLGCAATGRHGPEQGTGCIGHAGRNKFTIGIDLRVILAGKGPPGCNRLGKTHQGDTDRTRQQLPDQFDVRQGQRRQALRDQADR